MKIIRDDSFQPYTVRIESSIEHTCLIKGLMAYQIKHCVGRSIGWEEITNLIEQFKATQK